MKEHCIALVRPIIEMRKAINRVQSSQIQREERKRVTSRSLLTRGRMSHPFHSHAGKKWTKKIVSPSTIAPSEKIHQRTLGESGGNEYAGSCRSIEQAETEGTRWPCFMLHVEQGAQVPSCYVRMTHRRGKGVEKMRKSWKRSRLRCGCSILQMTQLDTVINSS